MPDLLLERPDLGDGDGFASGDTLGDFGTDFFGGRWGRKFVDGRNLDASAIVADAANIFCDVHKPRGRSDAHPELSFDPSGEPLTFIELVDAPKSLPDRDQLPPDLDDVLRRAGHAKADAGGGDAGGRIDLKPDKVCPGQLIHEG
jgi:hypothetical protein